MIKIIFVCWGNICRSPMAEYILKNLVKAGSLQNFYIASAATSTEEIGNPIYPPAARELRKHGIDPSGHHARQVTAADYDRFDLIIGMEQLHLDIMKRKFFHGDPDHKLHTCMEFAGRPDETVEDPWYTGDFSGVYRQLEEACRGILEQYGKH